MGLANSLNQRDGKGGKGRTAYQEGTAFLSMTSPGYDGSDPRKFLRRRNDGLGRAGFLDDGLHLFTTYECLSRPHRVLMIPWSSSPCAKDVEKGNWQAAMASLVCIVR